MAKIELQIAEGENPAIEWDDTITSLTEQSTEAQEWVAQNILSSTPVDTKETVHSVREDVDWDRIKSQLYTGLGFTLNVERTHFDTNSSRVQTSTYTLATV